MIVNIDEMPDNKGFDNYPIMTEFAHRELAPRYDREALKDNRIELVFYGDSKYESSVTREELNEMIRQL